MINSKANRDYSRTFTVAASAERTFDAIATLRGLQGWWTPLARGSDAPGGEIRLRFQGMEEYIDLHVHALRSPVEVVWSVIEHSSLDEWAGTELRFNISSVGDDECRVAFRHQGLTPSLDCYDNCKLGWDHFLRSIAAFAERGKGAPFGATAGMG